MSHIPDETFIFRNLELNEEVETITQAIIPCAIANLAHQIALRKTGLALIRHRQAELQLAQHLQTRPQPGLKAL